jgi:hypothetical protein
MAGTSSSEPLRVPDVPKMSRYHMVVRGALLQKRRTSPRFQRGGAVTHPPSCCTVDTTLNHDTSPGYPTKGAHMPLRPCLSCGQPTRNPRCPNCQRLHDNKRYRNRGPRIYDQDGWRQHSATLRAQWVATEGWTCPGWHTPPHPATDLVVDHDIGILCRQCNSRKAATHDRHRATHRQREGGGPTT